MPIRRENAYKPLSFTTTVRNPERLKDMLAVLKNDNGKVLTNALAAEVAGEFIRVGIYRPMRVSPAVKEKWKEGVPLSDEEAATILQTNPQNHKEAGFDRGWASRFDTWFKLAKELGFVYYEMSQPIEFSEVGLKLANTEHPEFEQQAFLNAFAKYQRNNPMRRVANENAPLILLLQVIKKLNADPAFNDAGITKLEVPLFLVWRNDDAEALYQKIKEIRLKHKYEPSWEVILKEVDELTGGRHASMPDHTIMVEYPDDFLRKMRLTGLITVRGYGRFIDLNKKELAKIDYILDLYAKYEKYTSERDYFNYISSVDEHLISIGLVYETNVAEENRLLLNWAAHFNWNTIKSEMLKLTTSSPSSTDAVLSLIPSPLRLEFLTSLAVLSKIPTAVVKPNYISDDEGLPSSHAPGNGADLECKEQEKYTLLEVTLLNGVVQVQREMPPISRHLHDFKSTHKDTATFFIAPVIHADTVRWVEFIKHKEGLVIYNFSIQEFLEYLEKTKKLYQMPFNFVNSPYIADVFKIPLVGSAPCGNPLLGQENIEEYIDVEKTKIKPGYEYFILKAEGDSMNLAGINDGNLVLCRQQLKADTGDIVVALLGDNVTIKEYGPRINGIRKLMPKSTNNDHSPIIPEAGDNVQGIVQEVLKIEETE